jgi:hypothetical protein
LLNLPHLIKERRVNPPLFKDQDERGRCLALENSPPLLRELHVRKEKENVLFLPKTYGRRERHLSALTSWVPQIGTD